MMSISSQAGRRLARAKAALDEAKLDPVNRPYGRAVDEFREAAHAVAAELIAEGFHEMDGED